MIWWILGGFVLLVLLFVFLAPLESLDWWAERGEDEIRETLDKAHAQEGKTDPAEHYVVFLSGVGSLGGELSRREVAWLDQLEARRPGVTVIRDVFPYSVDNKGLLNRTSAWLWRLLDNARRRPGPGLVARLIDVRNIAQVLVSADPRYGPTLSIGVAQQILKSLLRQGYVPGGGAVVSLVGFSGGGQMAVGSAWFLASMGVRVQIISVGGIFCNDPGLDRVEHVYHLVGTNDRTHYLGIVAFPGRWSTARTSHYNRAKRQGRFTQHMIGDMGHMGPGGYLGRRSHGRDGRSNADTTLDAVIDILDGKRPMEITEVLSSGGSSPA